MPGKLSWVMALMVLTALIGSGPAGALAQSSAAVGAAVAGSASEPAATTAAVALFTIDGNGLQGVRCENGTLEAVPETGPGNQGRHLKFRRGFDPSADAAICVRLPAELRPDPYMKLSAFLRTAPGPMTLRWLALDGNDWAIFQRRCDFQGEANWVRMDWPLGKWRWGAQRVGNWSEVRSLMLRVEKPLVELRLDGVEFTREGPARENPGPGEWVRRIAFDNRPYRMAEADDLLIGTDAPERLSQAQLQSLLVQVGRVRAWVKRVCPPAVQPVRDGGPGKFIVFASTAGRDQFLKRLGEQWNVGAPLPATDGYTIQDISACTLQEPNGVQEGEFLHEAVHLVVTRDLRLISGYPAHAWLHEGLATYLQLAVCPQALERGEYVRRFAQPIGMRTFFRPLDQILGQSVAPKHYAQLASLVAFLMQEHADWLARIAADLAQNRTLADILQSLGTDMDGLQRDWFAWGRKEFAEGKEPAYGEGRHFPLPQEWK